MNWWGESGGKCGQTFGCQEIHRGAPPSPGVKGSRESFGGQEIHRGALHHPYIAIIFNSAKPILRFLHSGHTQSAIYLASGYFNLCLKSLEHMDRARQNLGLCVLLQEQKGCSHRTPSKIIGGGGSPPDPPHPTPMTLY